MKSKSPSKLEQDPDEKVKIVIRLRPILNDQDPSKFVDLEDDYTLRIMKPGSQSFMRFSNILSSSAGQSDVFDLVKDSIHSFLRGVNSTVFAYGQTGAGKTYSIIGDYSHLDSRDNLETYLMGSERGILSRSLEMILQETKKVKDSRLLLSFFEIYNEKIYDLYNTSTTPLDIRESKNGEVSIPDLMSVEVRNLSQAIGYLSVGLKNRATGSTHANSKSSRSHSVFQITFERGTKGSTTEGLQSSSLRVVDLAGSQKFKIPSDLSSQQREVRIQELTSINGSLSCLGHCISALIDKSRTHIPFRNSKLTRILSDSLVGQGRMKFIVCISPSMSAHAETFSTLQFANRAKRAIVDRSPSKLSKKSSISEEFTVLKLDFQRQKQLRLELERQLHNALSASHEAENRALKKENQQLKEKIRQLTSQLNTSHQQENRAPLSTPVQVAGNCPDSHRGLLKLAVFKQNNQNLNKDSRQRKKLDFEKKMQRFIEKESPTRRDSPEDYSFNKERPQYDIPEDSELADQVPQFAAMSQTENQQTFEFYDEDIFQSEYDSNVNFIQNTCRNMKVQCLASLRSDMLRAKQQLQQLQEKDSSLEKRYTKQECRQIRDKDTRQPYH